MKELFGVGFAKKAAAKTNTTEGFAIFDDSAAPEAPAPKAERKPAPLAVKNDFLLGAPTGTTGGTTSNPVASTSGGFAIFDENEAKGAPEAKIAPDSPNAGTGGFAIFDESSKAAPEAKAPNEAVRATSQQWMIVPGHQASKMVILDVTCRFRKREVLVSTVTMVCSQDDDEVVLVDPFSAQACKPPHRDSWTIQVHITS